jgi:hypothetical protein
MHGVDQVRKVNRKLLNENVKLLTLITARVRHVANFENYEEFAVRSRIAQNVHYRPLFAYYTLGDGEARSGNPAVLGI